MYSLRVTRQFQKWLDELKDKKAQVRIAARLRQAEAGNLGDWKSVGGNVSMLAGGVKSGQKRDIKKAQQLLKELETEL